MPTRAALASGRRFDELVAAYGPVSARVNFLVAAETLRADAVEAGAGRTVERERFGAVRVELERMINPDSGVLLLTRPAVASVVVDDVDQQHVQDLMLAAIDARTRSLRELKVALRALADAEAPASSVDLLVQRWEASWDDSLRLAREATTAMQQSRAKLGLQPAPEESIR